MEKQKEEKANFLVLTDRRRLIDLMRNIEIEELSIRLNRDHTNERKQQLHGTIKEKDQFGNLKTKELLQREVNMQTDSLKNKQIKIIYMKEDLTNLVRGQDLKKLKTLLNEHVKHVKKEYDRIMNVLGG